MPQVQESRPSEYYLPDKDGKLQPVLGFRYEDFVELYQLKEELAERNQQPRYSLQRISATGTAGTTHAELTIRVGILVHEDDWVRIPLRFDQAVLREPVAYKGPGEQFLHFEGNGKGYVSWIRGQTGEEHELTLKMLVPLNGIGRETRLKLFVPRATWSELKLQVPVARAVGKVSERCTLETSSAAENGATEFRALGLGGDFELTWQKPEGPVAEVPTVLEAVGTVLARIDGRNVDTEATLSVRSYGAPFDRFRVLLPDGAELVPGNPTGYKVVPVDPSEQPASSRRLVEVQLAKKDSGPVEVRLATQRSHNVAKPDEWFELAGFEVVGAARQWGHLAVAAASGWQVRCRPSRGIQQIEVDQLPKTLQNQGVVAGFDYFAQPCSLTAQLLPKRTFINVEPEYLLLVDAHEVRLEANLKYTVRGAKAFKLDVALPSGWEFVDVGPENLAAVDGVAVVDSNVLSIPLLQPSTGQIELQLRARWPIPTDADSLVLPLPQPQVSSPGPAAVVVAPADNVELTPNNELMVELSRQQVDPQVARPNDRQQAPLFYRGETAKAVFAAGFRVHPQSIAVDVTSQLNLDRQSGRVQQRLAYTIQHQRTSHFTLQVPRSLADPDRLELLHEGQPLPPPTALPGEADQQDSPGPVRMMVALPEACIGLCELAIRYPLPLPKLAAGKPVVLSVPLVMPGEGNLSGNQVHVTATPGIKVAARKNSWTLSEAGAARPGQPQVLQLAADRRSYQVELTLELEDTDGDGEGITVVQRAWVQTWLTDSSRQDRAVFSFTSNRKEFRLVVPPETAVNQMDVRLDGKQVTEKTTEDGHLTIALPNDGNHHRHVLDLRSHVPQPRPPRGSMSIAIPQPGDDVWVRRLYWQLVLPQNEHVIATPKGFTSEFTWGWNGYFWGRQPLMDHSELEAWAGVAPTGVAPKGINCYLFSSMGHVDRCELRTAGRTWIVLLASGAVLVVGLLLIYVPRSRHPGALLAGAVVLLGTGVLYPEPALLLSQAASLGLALILVAGLLERSVVRRRRIAKLPETSGVDLEKGSTQTQHAPLAADNQLSPQVAPPVAPPSTPDSNA